MTSDTTHVPPADAAAGGPQAEDWTLRPGAPADTAEAPAEHAPAVFDSSMHLLLTDVRAASLLLNELRILTIRGVFGVDRRQANLMTAIAALMVADGAYAGGRRLVGDVRAPSGVELLFGLSAGAVILRGIGGLSARETPGFGALVGLGLVDGLAGPTVRRALRDTGAGVSRSRAAFRRRYGHLIRVRRTP